MGKQEQRQLILTCLEFNARDYIPARDLQGKKFGDLVDPLNRKYLKIDEAIDAIRFEYVDETDNTIVPIESSENILRFLEEKKIDTVRWQLSRDGFHYIEAERSRRTEIILHGPCGGDSIPLFFLENRTFNDLKEFLFEKYEEQIINSAKELGYERLTREKIPIVFRYEDFDSGGWVELDNSEKVLSNGMRSIINKSNRFFWEVKPKNEKEDW